jgi:hypothetical protein
VSHFLNAVNTKQIYFSLDLFEEETTATTEIKLET